MNIEAIHKAWHAVGADIAGLKWADFVKHLPPAAPVQEPGAEAYALADKIRTELDKQSCPGVYMNIAWESILKFHRGLIYTAPPAAQRPWVGLTEQERDTLIAGGYDRDTIIMVEGLLKGNNT